MKEITDKTKLSANGIYGVLSALGVKGFVNRLDYMGVKYAVCAIQAFGLGNNWRGASNSMTLTELEEFIYSPNYHGSHASAFRLFSFETPEELFSWLAGHIKTPAVPKPKPAKKKNKKVYKFQYPIHGDRWNGYENRIVVVEEEDFDYIMGTDYNTGDGKTRKFLKYKIRGEIEKVN